MNYNVYINQKHIDSNHRLAMNEFIKRLSAYCNIILHIGESHQISSHNNKTDKPIIIVERGTSTYSSVDFSKYIEQIQLTGTSSLSVIIGYQRSDIFVSEAGINDESLPGISFLSISSTALSDQTTALLFLEQLYRGYTIIQGKTYHK